MKSVFRSFTDNRHNSRISNNFQSKKLYTHQVDSNNYSLDYQESGIVISISSSIAYLLKLNIVYTTN